MATAARGTDSTAAARGGPLTGCTVGVTAERRADDLAAMLRRRGATVLHAPALHTIPLPDDRDLLTATRQVTEAGVDVAVVTTGVGFRGWLAAAEGWGLGEALLGRLRTATVLTRGPKATGAVRAGGLGESWSPASEATAEMLEHLLHAGVNGARVAVQQHGDPLTDFVAALRRAGADVVEVPVYRWTDPVDPVPLDALLAAVAAREVDAVTFTSAPAAANLLRRAQRTGRLRDVRQALGTDVLAACVGSVTAGPLAEAGITTVQPDRGRLGSLVRTLEAELLARPPVRAQ